MYYNVEVYPFYTYLGYISKCWIYDMGIYPFEILDMLIYPQIDLDLGYFFFIKYPFLATGNRIWIYTNEVFKKLCTSKLHIEF